MTENVAFDYSAAVAMLDRIKLSESSTSRGGAADRGGAAGGSRGAASVSSSPQSSTLPTLSPAVAAATTATATATQGKQGSMVTATAGSGSNGTTGATGVGSGGGAASSSRSASSAARRPQKATAAAAAPWRGPGDSPSQASAPAVMAENSARMPAHPGGPSPAANGAAGGRSYRHQPPPNATERGLGTAGAAGGAALLRHQPMYSGRNPRPPEEVELDNRTAVQSMSSVSNPSAGASGSGSFGSRSRSHGKRGAKSNGGQENHPPPPVSVGGGLPVVLRPASRPAGQLPPTVEESVALEQLAAAEAAGTASVAYSTDQSSVTMSTNPSSGMMMRTARGGAVALQQDAQLPPPSPGGHSGPSPASTEEGKRAAHRAALGASTAPRRASGDRPAARRSSNERQAPGGTAASRRGSNERKPAASRRGSNERQPAASRRGSNTTNRSLFRRSSGDRPQHLQPRPQAEITRSPSSEQSATMARRSSNDHAAAARRSSNDSRPPSRRTSNEQKIAEQRLKMLGNSTPSMGDGTGGGGGGVDGRHLRSPGKDDLSSSVGAAAAASHEERMHMSMVDFPQKDLAAATAEAAAAGAAATSAPSANAEDVALAGSSASSRSPAPTSSSTAENGGAASGVSSSGASPSPASEDDGAAAQQRTPLSPDNEKAASLSSSGSGAAGVRRAGDRRDSADNGGGVGVGRTNGGDGNGKRDAEAGVAGAATDKAKQRRVSVHELMLERELTGLNEEFNKTKQSRRASLSLSSVAPRSRRSSAQGSSSVLLHDSGTTASNTTGEAGGSRVQFVLSGDEAAAAAGEDVIVAAGSEKRQMWNDWYERRRRPTQRRGRSRSPGRSLATGGKDWRDVLIDGIAGFGKHAPRCVLGDVAAYLREIAPDDNGRGSWDDEGETYGIDGPVRLEEIEAIDEDNSCVSSISDGGGVNKDSKAKAVGSKIAPDEELAYIDERNGHPQAVLPGEETSDNEGDPGNNLPAKPQDISNDQAAFDSVNFTDEENEKRKHFPRRPSMGYDTRGIHRPDAIPLQVGLEDDTEDGGKPRPTLIADDDGRDAAPVRGTGSNVKAPRRSSESVAITNRPNSVTPKSAGLHGDFGIPSRRSSDCGISRQSNNGGNRRGSMEAVSRRDSTDSSSNRRSSMGNARPTLNRLASNRSAFISVVSDATTVEAGHRRPRRGSGGPLALVPSLSQSPHQVERSGAVSPVNAHRTTFDLPHYGSRQSALLFVDISGFTKLSTLLDIEDLSRAINSYFDLIVTEVLSHGGDVLKFAGDALFAEWQVTAYDDDEEPAGKGDEDRRYSSIGAKDMSDFGSVVGNKDGAVPADGPGRRGRKRESEGLTLTECVMAASFCGASICQKCSGYKVYATAGESKNSRSRRSSAGARKKRSVAKLEVHSGIGVGQMVGLHVSNLGVVEGKEPSEKRREFLFLGDPIDQVAKAEGVAQTGELVASPEVVKILAAVCNIPDSILSCEGPSVVARRSECFISSKIPWEPAGLAVAAGPLAAGSNLPPYESLDAMCDDLDSHTLEMLRDQLSLYVHPVVRGDQLAKAEGDAVQPSSQEQHRAEAELRSVYVMFILPLISAQVSGDPDVDRELFTKLSGIMKVTNRELVKFSGHLRQFIVDDKGVVLIGTFGLRGSTFPNMVPENALPATLSIHKALKSELNVDNKVGATFGKVYCGVVGGVHRHEFAVLGPSVNLAARLMASKENTGVLVDEAVQSHAKAKFRFRSHSEVTAKGYAKPVPTFEPLDSINQKIDDSIGIVGRKQEIKQVMDVMRKIIEDSTPIPTQLVFLGGESGVGKTAIIVCLIEKIKTFCALYYKHVAICRSSSRENEQLVPLSGFKSVLLYAVREYCLFDGTVSVQHHRDSLSSLKRSMRRDSGRFLRRDSMASQVSTIEVPYMSKIRWVCSDLGYNPAYADIVGARLLGLEEADAAVCTVDGEVPKLENIVGFLAAAFIRFTRHVGVTLVTIDDVQWIDALSWKVINALWDKGEDMLILGGLRESDLGGRRRRSSAREWDEEEEGSRFTNISLGALERADMKVLMSKALYYHESSIDDDFVNDVYEKTGGIPVFALEMLENIKRNDLVEVQESGLLGLKPTSQGEQGKSENQGPGVVDELFLQRLDALDLPVRKVLQSCAVLGMEFFLSDVLRVNPEYESAETLQKALDSAVTERILVEDMEDGSDEDSVKGHCGEMKNAGLASSNRSFRFSQAMWRDIVLRTMLKDRQMDLHRNIAKTMEADGVSEFSDTRTLLKLFDHWKACCDFLKAAPLALAIGARLEEWESSQQSLDLYCSALAMWRTDTKVNASLETLGAWYEPSLSSNALAFVVRLKTRVGKCLHDIGDEKKGALAYRDAYLIMTKLPASKRVDRSLIFPVISGLWLSIPWDQIVSNDSNFSVEQELVQRFVDEAQAFGDPIHCCRALAMQGSLYSRMSDFPRALEVQRQLECVYSYSEHSSGIFEAYGSDFAALSFGNSVQWYDLVSDDAMASKQMDFVLNKLLPKFHPVAVHDSMGVLFPVLMVMKSKGMSKDAILMFQNHVLDRFKALGIKSTYFYPLYKPTSFLLELARRDDSLEDENGMLEEVQEWALKGEKISPIPMLERNGQFIQGEVCWRIARRKALEDPLRAELIRRGTSLLKRVMKKVQHDGSYAFMVKEAYFVYTDLQKMKETKPVPAPPPAVEKGCKCCIS